MTEAAKAPKGSKKAQSTAARLFAVQAIYQSLQNDQVPGSVIDEYLRHNVGMDLEDGDQMIQPDGALFRRIVQGVSDRQADFETLVKANTKDPAKNIEPLLFSILLCGAAELVAHHEIDAPIIISDYLDVTHAFYEGSEPKLVNAILDAISKEIRSL